MSDVNCDDLRFFHTLGNDPGPVLCHRVCPPYKTGRHNVKFCADNCEEYLLKCAYRYSTTTDAVTSTLEELTRLPLIDKQTDYKTLFFLIGVTAIVLILLAVIVFVVIQRWKDAWKSDIHLPRPVDPEAQRFVKADVKQDGTDIDAKNGGKVNDAIYHHLDYRAEVMVTSATNQSPDFTKKQIIGLPAQKPEHSTAFGGNAAFGAALFKLHLTHEGQHGQHNCDLHSTESYNRAAAGPLPQSE